MDFGQWIDEQMRLKGIERDSELAARGKFDQSLIQRWRTARKPPQAHTMRRIAEALNLPLLQVMVGAGYLTAAEANMVEVQADLSAVPDDQLLREVGARMARGATVHRLPPTPAEAAAATPEHPVHDGASGKEDWELARLVQDPEDVGRESDGRAINRAYAKLGEESQEAPDYDD